MTTTKTGLLPRPRPTRRRGRGHLRERHGLSLTLFAAATIDQRAPLTARGGGGEPSCRSAACRRGPGRHDAAGFGRWARRARRCQAHLKEAPRCCGCGRVEREQRLKLIFPTFWTLKHGFSTFWTLKHGFSTFWPRPGIWLKSRSVGDPDPPCQFGRPSSYSICQCGRKRSLAEQDLRIEHRLKYRWKEATRSFPAVYARARESLIIVSYRLQSKWPFAKT